MPSSLVFGCQEAAHGLWAFFERNPTIPLVLVGTLVAYFSLRSQQHLTRAKHTLDFDKSFKENQKKDDWGRAIGLLREKSWSELQAIGKLPIPDEDFKALGTALNVWEGVAIGIRNKVYNEKMLSDAFGTSVVWLYNQALPYLIERRNSNPRLYENFRWLGLRWAAKFSIPMKEARELEVKKRAYEADLAKAEAAQREQVRQQLLVQIKAGEISLN